MLPMSVRSIENSDDGRVHAGVSRLVTGNDTVLRCVHQLAQAVLQPTSLVDRSEKAYGPYHDSVLSFCLTKTMPVLTRTQEVAQGLRQHDETCEDLAHEHVVK